ncbi:Biopterin-dependent aromatic amino acid hydroxylase [Oesophagostomum dentatum]|uniref:Biopterin-dependent aromatic amino acid hydroxylase n=1 Tax=Oesophagostomum dentatum TaxID=61180 RepID=A0A0B1S7S8_OESDE|nr:Biopterin-dependent aromatic amino acid hydroxylase [Oesophagostomum dentatum]
MASENQCDSPRHPRRFSLVHQASCEAQKHAGLKRQNTQLHREQLREITRGEQILQKLNDEGVELIWAADKGSIAFTSVLSSSSDLATFIREVVEAFASNNIHITHLETRRDKSEKGWDLLADCDATKEQLIAAAATLTKQHVELTKFALYKKDAVEEVPWFPRHISELDKCSRCITKYDPTTDPRHPGHDDDAYIARRQFLNDQALEYKHGDPIPLVDYTEEEHATWRAVYEKLRGLHESHTCEAYRRNFKMLEEAGVLTADRIPQIRDVNKYLQSKGPRCN